MVHPLCDFVHNKYMHVIPISPEAYDDDFASGFSQSNLHVELNDSVRGGARLGSNFSMFNMLILGSGMSLRNAAKIGGARLSTVNMVAFGSSISIRAAGAFAGRQSVLNMMALGSSATGLSYQNPIWYPNPIIQTQK